jgi:DNA-directed RNA polymerase subunit L
MRLYCDNKVILSVRIPRGWKKVLTLKAKKEKTTLGNIMREILEKKFRCASD